MIASLILTNCNPPVYSWVDCTDDTVISVYLAGDNEYTGVGLKRLYYLSGSPIMSYNGEKVNIVPGTCYDISTGKLHRFLIFNFIKKNVKQYPVLLNDSIKKAAAAQLTNIGNEKVPESIIGPSV